MIDQSLAGRTSLTPAGGHVGLVMRFIERFASLRYATLGVVQLFIFGWCSIDYFLSNLGQTVFHVRLFCLIIGFYFDRF